MLHTKKIVSSILVTVMIVISILSFNVSAKGDVYNVASEGITYIEAEGCSDYIPALESYFGREYMSFNNGQWMEYYLDAEKSGFYILTTYVGRVPSETPLTFTATIDGENPKSAIVPDSGEWLDFKECKLLEVELKEGRNVLKIAVSGGGCHFDRFTLTRIKELESESYFIKESGAYRNVYLPAIIEAEDYDLGESGSFSINGINDGGKYRRDDKMDIYSMSPEGFYLALCENEEVNYTFNVSAEEIYSLYFTKGAGDILLYLDSFENPLVVNGGDKEGFNEVFAGNILLKEGKHTLKIKSVNGDKKIDSFWFKLATEGVYYTEKHFEDGFPIKEEQNPEPTAEPTIEPTAESTAEPIEEPDPFCDIANHWAYDSIKLAAKSGVIKGYPDGSFAPDASVTVNDACVIAMRATGIAFDEKSPKDDIIKYGLTSCDDYERFVTREEFAQIIVSALNFGNDKISGKYSSKAFADESEISMDKIFYVHTARSLSLMKGDENKNFRPNDFLARAEAVTILTRIK